MTATFLSGALLLASCGGGEAPAPDPQPVGQADTIVGDIEPNQDLPTAVNVPLLRESAVAALRDLRAPVDRDGRFTLTLPGAEVMNQAEDLQTAALAFGCVSDGSGVSAPAGNLFFPVRYVAGVDNGREYFEKLDSGAENEASVKRIRVYAKQDATVKITPTAGCNVSADLNLKAGWNVVEETLPLDGGASYKMTTLPAGSVIFRDTKLFAGSVGQR